MRSYDQRLEARAQDSMLRQLKPLCRRSGGMVEVGGRTLVNLSSNDYLGLAGNQEFLERFYRAKTPQFLVDRYGLGVASSRLLTGDLACAHELEDELASLFGAQAALLFNSGYHANIGIIPALFGKRDLILSDKLNHASIYDGLRICRADYRRFRHCDYEHLRHLLERHRRDYDEVLIVSESIFSMDGDCADLVALVELKERYDCLLYLDEAHAFGLYGDKGLGLAERDRLIDKVDLLVGTFGKACGSVGAFLVCSRVIREYLVNESRSLIFTTGLPPVVLSWNLFVTRQLAAMGDKRRDLATLADKVRQRLYECGVAFGGTTHIIPVLIGSASRTVAAAKYLEEQGFFVLPIRPPTVPEGSSRFRLSLTADLEWRMLSSLAEHINTWMQRQGP